MKYDNEDIVLADIEKIQYIINKKDSEISNLETSLITNINKTISEEERENLSYG